MVSRQVIGDVVGALGGVVLALCLVPQLLKAYKTKSTGDLAYLWLATYVVGLLLNLAYFVLINALVGYIGVCVEIGCALLLLWLKIYYEKIMKKKPDDIEEIYLPDCDAASGTTPKQSDVCEVSQIWVNNDENSIDNTVTAIDTHKTMQLPVCDELLGAPDTLLRKASEIISDVFQSAGVKPSCKTTWRSQEEEEGNGEGSDSHGFVFFKYIDGSILCEFSWVKQTWTLSWTGNPLEKQFSGMVTKLKQGLIEM